MKRTQVGLETRLDRGFLNAFVQLKKMRMAGTDTDPNNVRAPFAWELSQAKNRKKKWFPRDGTEIFLELILDLARNVAEKTESKVHLLGLKPPHPAHSRIQAREELSDG